MVDKLPEDGLENNSVTQSKFANGVTTGTINPDNPGSDLPTEAAVVDWLQGLGISLDEDAETYSGNMNSLTRSGIYGITSGVTNGATTNHGVCIVTRTMSGGKINQIWLNTPNTADDEIYIRNRDDGGIWSSWKKIITSQNIGGYVDNVPDTQRAYAWVDFNGNNGNIRSSYNISSVSRNNTGKYTINFQNNRSNNNYTVVTGAVNNNNAQGGSMMNGAGDYGTSSFNMHTRGNDISNSDAIWTSAVVFGH